MECEQDQIMKDVLSRTGVILITPNFLFRFICFPVPQTGFTIFRGKFFFSFIQKRNSIKTAGAFRPGCILYDPQKSFRIWIKV